MRKIRLLFVCLTVFLSTAAVASAQQPVKAQTTESDWIGTYGYTQVFDRNSSSGYADTVEFTIVVSKKGNSLVARFTASGYQADDDYEYTAKVAGNQLDLYFLKDSRSADMAGMDRHLKKRQLMGSLYKTTVRGKAQYVFRDKIFFNPRRPPAFKKKS